MAQQVRLSSQNFSGRYSGFPFTASSLLILLILLVSMTFPVLAGTPIIRWSPGLVSDGDMVTFDTVDSYTSYSWWISDGPGNPCDWEFGSPDSTDSTFTYTFYNSGVWQVCLEVPDEFDPDGYYTDIQTVTVNNQPPVIDEPYLWTATPEPSFVGFPFHVEVPFTDYEDAAADYLCTVNYGDGDGEEAGTIAYISGYAWKCIGPDHTYTAEGQFDVGATVADDVESSSHSDSYSHTVTVRTPQTLTVNSINDVVDGSGCNSTHCSLREAVQAAYSGDTIGFSLTTPATITLGSHIIIDKSLTIVGPGAQELTISGGEVDHYTYGNDHGGVFYLHGIAVGDVTDPITVSISGLTIMDGRAHYGGGIANGDGSTLTMTDCVIGPNNIVTYAGGGIENKEGTLILNRCTVVENHGTGSTGGAGIFADMGSLTLINTTVTGNITNNEGGGILAWFGSTVTLVHSTITENTSNQDYLQFPYGGGGGIFNRGNPISIQNSIVAGNIDLTGLVNPSNPSYHVAWPDVKGTFTSLGGNLVGDGTGSTGWGATDLIGNAAEPIDPLLDAVAIDVPAERGDLDYETVIYTYALLKDSPAIDAADCLEGVTIDQRGISRPQGIACDIGAYEAEAAAGAFNKTSPANGATNQPDNPTLSWETSSNAGFYEYCISTTNPCSTWINNGTSTSVALTGLLFDTTFYWQARAFIDAAPTYANNTAANWSFTTTVLPVLTSISPTTRLAGLPGTFTLTVNGSNFVNGDVVRWDGVAKPTTFVSPTRLTAVIPAADVDEVDEVDVTVVRPGFESSPSNYMHFLVYTFADVLPSHPLWRYVEGFFAKGITTGCNINPLRYCPEQAVTRGQMAVFILRAVHEDDPGDYVPSDVEPDTFTDPPVAAFMEPWIEQFYAEGYTTGCAVNPLRFCPEKNITRGEMAVFLLRAKFGSSYVPVDVNPDPFIDPPKNAWMEPWIEQFYKEGFTTGCGGTLEGEDLRYCPERNAGRAEMATFIDRIFGYPPLPELIITAP